MRMIHWACSVPGSIFCTAADVVAAQLSPLPPSWMSPPTRQRVNFSIRSLKFRLILCCSSSLGNSSIDFCVRRSCSSRRFASSIAHRKTIPGVGGSFAPERATFITTSTASRASVSSPRISCHTRIVRSSVGWRYQLPLTSVSSLTVCSWFIA